MAIDPLVFKYGDIIVKYREKANEPAWAGVITERHPSWRMTLHHKHLPDTDTRERFVTALHANDFPGMKQILDTLADCCRCMAAGDPESRAGNEARDQRAIENALQEDRELRKDLSALYTEALRTRPAPEAPS